MDPSWRRGMLVALSITGLATALFALQYWSTGDGYWFWAATVFGVWAAFRLFYFIRLQIPVRFDAERLEISGLWHTHRIGWAQLVWSHIEPGRRAGVICYEAEGTRKYAAISLRALGRNLGVLINAIDVHRPDIPKRNPDAPQANRP